MQMANSLSLESHFWVVGVNTKDCHSWGEEVDRELKQVQQENV